MTLRRLLLFGERQLVRYIECTNGHDQCPHAPENFRGCPWEPEHRIVIHLRKILPTARAEYEQIAQHLAARTVKPKRKTPAKVASTVRATDKSRKKTRRRQRAKNTRRAR